MAAGNGVILGFGGQQGSLTLRLAESIFGGWKRRMCQMKELSCYLCGKAFPVSGREWEELGLSSLGFGIDEKFLREKNFCGNPQAGITSSRRPFCNSCLKKGKRG